MRYHDEAMQAASSDIDSEESGEKITDYRTLGEIINQFGTALIAFDDMEEAELEPESEDMN